MEASAYEFGPISNLRFDSEVGRFLHRGGLTKSELSSLREFFKRLQTDPISVDQHARPVTADTWVLNVANHNVYLRLTGPGRGIVVGIRPDSTLQGGRELLEHEFADFDFAKAPPYNANIQSADFANIRFEVTESLDDLPRAAAGGKSFRLQLEMSEEAVRQIDLMLQESGVTTKSELIRNALALLEWAIDETKKGNFVGSMNKASKTYRELRMPALEGAANNIRR
jgi:hypothetical protein